MRDGWRQVTLGELFEPSKTRLGEHDAEPPVFSISKHNGVMPAEEFFGKRVASANLANYKTLSADAWVYSTIHIDEGSIARNNTGVDGVVSPMYTVMSWSSRRDDPRYLEYLLRSKEMLAAYADSSQGSINRRRSLSWKAFSTISIVLPSLNEQQRIVDLIAAVHHAIEAAEMEAVASFAALERTRDLFIWHGTADRIHLGEVATIAGHLVDPSSASHSCLPHIGTERIESCTGDLLGVVSAAEDGVTSGKFLHEAGTIVYSKIRPNLRKVTIPSWRGLCSADAYPVLPKSEGDVSFLRHLLVSRPFTREAVARSGRTKMPKINKTELMSIQVPAVRVEDQTRIASVLDSMDQARVSARTTADALGSLRSNLLSALLSGEHEIPASYDEFLETA
ncbi:restriction endonuclease subunit S [Cryobacterium sp. TMT2-17-1]|uniref:restriction endonuclease subunit S n=1 Tax=Cryobacterium sp. TMT2-17-1 TaxID=1259248 RepID=UPI00106A2F5D|nr:restriction endonuclease subunit S [Cryobacterium sp. TMT2-17-1]TFC50857.1 restriction endonuclease subunit S [Cryobacterium sp. TMT2-17-1]